MTTSSVLESAPGRGGPEANLEVEELRVDLGSSKRDIVADVSFSVRAGEVLGLVGESGCGKTTVALALLGWARRGARIVGGNVRIEGENLLRMTPARLSQARGRLVAYVPQDPAASLNPSIRIGEQIAEVLAAHDFGGNDANRRQRMSAVLTDVKLPPSGAFLRRFPHQLSGGQQQRVALAMAFACVPKVIVMDEPTTGLDVTTQAHILETVRQLSREYQASTVYVSHDLAVISSIADRVAVMYAGRMVDIGPSREVLGSPEHPYTLALRLALPELKERRRLSGIPGIPPLPGRRPVGCSFAARCQFSEAACRVDMPPLVEVRPGRWVRCFQTEAVRRARDVITASVSEPETPGENADAILSIRQLHASYGDTEILHDVNLDIAPGACVALVGESGSGKTTLAKAIAGLHHQRTGTIVFKGRELDAAARSRTPETRRLIQYIFQNPYASLSPRRTIGSIIAQPLRLLTDLDKRQRHIHIAEALERVSLRPELVDRYPDELSGGERQRVAIARALAVNPEVVLCDEVTSALDVSVQALVLTMLRNLQRELGLSLLFTTHNLAVVTTIADEVIVLQEGHVVERGPVDQVLSAPRHPYTRSLIGDSPELVVSS